MWQNILLKDINGLLQSQTELKKLNVSSNRLQWFDYAFIPKVQENHYLIIVQERNIVKSVFWFQSLEMIDLHNNQIEELGNYFKLKVKGENNNSSWLEHLSWNSLRIRLNLSNYTLKQLKISLACQWLID